MTEPGNPSHAVAVPSASPALPPSPAARDQVVELLTRHFANDGMALEEFERRTSAAFAARSADELHALVADVPGATASSRALPVIVPEHGRVSAVLSNTEQHSTMVVPRHLEVVSILGNAELDLRDATFGDGVTIVEVRSILGNVEITVPHDVRVEMAGSAFLGSFASHAGESTLGAASSGERVVRVVGRAVLGNVELFGAAPALPPAPTTPALPAR